MPHHKMLMSGTWKQFERASDELRVLNRYYIDRFGEHLTDPKIEMSVVEREEMAFGVITAASDTTAHTALWTMICLSENPHIQEKLYEEITKVYSGGPLTHKHIQLPYLRGFLKEVFRVKPIIAMLRRVLTEDLVLSGYSVPTGSVVNLTLAAYEEEDWYTEANEIKPERWMRPGKRDSEATTAAAEEGGGCPAQHHSFGVLPFGYGHRSCLGKRLAESELYLLIAKLVYNYKVLPVKEYESLFSLFITPKGEIDIKLEKRH